MDTATATPADSATATRTATVTQAITPTAAPTNTPPATETPPPTATSTEAPTETATALPTDTTAPTATSTEVPSETPTPTPSEAPSETPTAAPTATDTPADTPTITDTPTDTPTATPVPVLGGASRSSAVAIAGNESFVILVNPDNDSVSVFSTATNQRRALVTTGDQPVAVAIHPDDRRAYVANRGEATILELVDVDSDAPAAGRRLEVGSEPTGLALSPTGALLFVAEWAEGRVSVIDTATMSVVTAIDAPRNPRTVAVTNDGDADDGDETLVVVEFYGEPNPDVSGCPNGTAEVCDTGRIGRLRRYSLASFAPAAPILLQPLDSGIVPAGSPEGTASVLTAPNQLYAAALRDSKVYVTSVSASPQAPIRFNANVFPVLYVADLTTGEEDRSPAGTVNLAKLANDAIGDAPGTDRFFLQEPVDIAFLGGSNVAYVVSRAADVVQEVVFDAAEGVQLGLPQINVGSGPSPCQNPIGIAVAEGLNRAYVNCWITRRMAVIDLAAKQVVATAQSADLPAADSVENDVRLGQRFYFTGRGRWSEEGEGYSSCGSCHPDGLSDGITWAFGAGPRQTTSMDGSFSHGAGPQKQRIFNWTAIFDEVHDFEGNTRGVSSGLGAITTSPGGMCGTLATEERIALPGGLDQPVKEIQESTPGACTDDWDKITAFVKTIRPPRARRSADAEAVARGEALFARGECAKCHGGAGWTFSRLYWTPSSANNTALSSTPFTAPTTDAFWPIHTVQIGTQPASADGTGTAIGPKQVACVLREVRSFGITDDTPATELLERRADGTRAQGRAGFNVPSLYGLAVGAPYLHHGQAATLEDLFTDPRWEGHLTAANPSFAPTEAELRDLIDFLLSIDAATPEQPVPAGFDGCPSTFPAGTTSLATLDGAQESPPVESPGSGSAAIEVSGDGSALTFDLTVNGIDPVKIAQAHIHVGPPGTNGPVVLFLAHGPFAGRLSGRLTEADLIPNPGVGISTLADVVEAFRTGDAYVNVHTEDHPGGEIRGQVRAPSTFLAELSGSQEVPASGSSAGGSATFTLDPERQSLSFEVNVSGLDPSEITQAHLHVAPPGFNGSVVLLLTTTPPAALPFRGQQSAADLIPSEDASILGFADFVEALQAGDVYVNVHSNARPGGEVRGQLRGAADFPATLSGDQESPGVETAASGSADLQLSADESRLRFNLTTDLAADQIVEAHLHVGAPGVNGPPVFFLAESGFAGLRRGILDAADLLPSSEAGIETMADFVRALRSGNVYVNIHTRAHLGGEIRGQLGAPVVLNAILSGSEEIPEPVVTEASGQARVVLSPGRDHIRFALSVSALPAEQITQAHLHVGPAGAVGPPVLFLAGGPFGALRVGTLDGTDLLPSSEAGIETFADFAAALLAGNVYANVHTMAHPGGEIRGPLQAQ